LSVANLGDSRTYLIDGSVIEQLTVDGDLASGMLAEGSPPEHVFEVGPIVKALRECIGGCMHGDGELTILEDGCIPTLTRWPILPGDVIVLCSDGLIEENMFLEPGMVAEMVRERADWTAQQLAAYLVEQADKSHRLPSPLEPEGFGDNISCIVIKVAAAVTTPPLP
jgi:serine/threonine protein phosphatase PrpC